MTAAQVMMNDSNFPKFGKGWIGFLSWKACQRSACRDGNVLYLKYITDFDYNYTSAAAIQVFCLLQKCCSADLI